MWVALWLLKGDAGEHRTANIPDGRMEKVKSLFAKFENSILNIKTVFSGIPIHLGSLLFTLQRLFVQGQNRVLRVSSAKGPFDDCVCKN
jgi:hypothetical protein